jgi:UDP-glucuronate 4-epimerase
MVTGAGGFIGSNLCDALLAQGHDVVGLDAFVDYYPRHFKEANLGAALADRRFTLVEADLRVDELDPLIEGVDAVIHEAAMPGLPRSWDDVEHYTSCNIVATHRLIQACGRQRVGRLVHASTSSVYGSAAEGDESMPLLPVSPYGVTKLAAEHLLRASAEIHDLDHVILRYFSIYGPRQRPDMAYRLFIERMAAGEAITIFGDGTQYRSNTYVGDCVDATIAALTAGRTGEVYNIGGGETVSVLDAIEIIAAHLGVRPRLEFRARRPGDQLRTRADSSKAGRELGYHPGTSIVDGLAREIEWFQRQLPALSPTENAEARPA